MVYDPERHQRHSVRRQGYDYRQSGAYYVTICTHERECLFGEVSAGRMCLNEYGDIVLEEWERTEASRSNVLLDAFVIMPNHMHGILVIFGAEGFESAPAQRQFAQPIAGSLATILGAFKSAASRRINALRGTPGFTVWQRNYHERIIREDWMLHNARRYIENNPLRWAQDINNPANVTSP